MSIRSCICVRMSISRRILKSQCSSFSISAMPHGYCRARTLLSFNCSHGFYRGDSLMLPKIIFTQNIGENSISIFFAKIFLFFRQNLHENLGLKIFSKFCHIVMKFRKNRMFEKVNILLWQSARGKTAFEPITAKGMRSRSFRFARASSSSAPSGNW